MFQNRWQICSFNQTPRYSHRQKAPELYSHIPCSRLFSPPYPSSPPKYLSSQTNSGCTNKSLSTPVTHFDWIYQIKLKQITMRYCSILLEYFLFNITLAYLIILFTNWTIDRYNLWSRSISIYRFNTTAHH